MLETFKIGPYECYIGDIEGTITGNAYKLKTTVLCKNAYKRDEAVEAAKYLCNALGAHMVELHRTDLHKGQLKVYSVAIYDVDYDAVMTVREVV